MFRDILGEAFPILEKVAPVIATVLGSPIAGLATTCGINLLAHAFNIRPNNLQDLSYAILQDPDAESKIQSVESYFAEWFKSNGLSMKMPSNIEINIKLSWQPQI